MCFLISLVVLLIVFAIIWMIIGKIPVPADYLWIVQVVLLIAFLLSVLEILTGGLTFCGVFTGVHGLGRG